mgnify:CR=1 FL=1
MARRYGRTPIILDNPFAEEMACRLYIQGIGYTQIAAELVKAGIPANKNIVFNFLKRPANQHIVAKYKQKYLSDPEAIGIFHKTIRLEDLNRERVRIINTINTLCKGSEGIPEKKVSKYLNLSKRLIDVEIAGRDEVDKRPDLIALFQRIGPYSEVSDAELLRERGVIESQLLIVRQGKGITPKENPDRQGTEGSSEEKSA